MAFGEVIIRFFGSGILVNIAFLIPFAGQPEIVQLFFRIALERIRRIIGFDIEMVIQTRNYPVLVVMRLRIDEGSAEYAKRNDIRLVLLNLGQERLDVFYFLMEAVSRLYLSAKRFWMINP